MSYEYLDILARPLDKQQRAVCCRTDNTVVAAGAGSGKTQVLSTRFAWLLMEDSSLSASSILTLTFTKKAAAEMYQRIYETLTVFANDTSGKVDEVKKQNAKRAVADFASVHIQTLDSYCGGIVRQAANRYGIRPDFSTGSAAAEGNIKSLALPFVLLNRNNRGIQHFCEAGKMQEFAEDIIASAIIRFTSMATEDDFFTQSLKKQKKVIIEEWNKLVTDKCELGLCDCISNLEQLLNDEDVIQDLTNKKENILPLIDKFRSDEIPELCKISDFNDTHLVKKVVDYLTCLPLSGRIVSKKNGNAETVKSYINALKDKLIPYAASIMAYINDYDYLEQLFILMDEFLQKVNSAKRSSGALTFADVTEMALKILIEQKDIREQEKTSYKKIMIDEFQDNNGKNRDLLFLLAEKEGLFTQAPLEDTSSDALHKALKKNLVKDKLFFVGDEKQSIYKFRGADVSVFNELKTDMAEINGPESSMHMVYNYRSSSELLSSFNLMFGSHKASVDGMYETVKANSVFDNDSPHPFEAHYSESSIAKKAGPINSELLPAVLTEKNIKGHVSLFVYNRDTLRSQTKQNIYLNNEETIAYYTAKKIREIYDSLPLSDADWSRFAILDKSRTNRHYICRWLERFHIPYSLDQQSRLFNDALVNDIYSFMRLCVYPSDINAFSSFLCSPFTGLYESELEKILGAVVDVTDRDYVFTPFADKDDEAVKEALGEDSISYKRYVRTKEFFCKNSIMVLSQGVTDTLNLLWYTRGYRFETLLNESVNILEEQYDLLFELARKCDEDSKGLGWFVDQLSLQKAEEAGMSSEDIDMNTKEVNYPVEKGSCVQIMTIHKSKGLQFDHVFLLGITGASKSDRQEKLFYTEELGVSLKASDGTPNIFFIREQEESRLKNLAEYRRLIYVGVTRAVKDFYIIGKYEIDKDGIHNDNETSLMDGLISYYYPGVADSNFTDCFNSDAPFDMEKLDKVEKTVLSGGNEADIDLIRHEKITAVKTLYDDENAQVITTPALPLYRVSPSSFEKLGADEQEGEGEYQSCCIELDKMYEKLSSVDKSFGFNDLGSTLHYYFQQIFNGGDRTSIYLEVPYLKVIRRSQPQLAVELDKLCLSIAEGFEKSEYGKRITGALQSGRFCRTEYVFKMNIEGYLLTGSIDICFEDEDGTLVIIDYKTDHKINTSLYLSQQTCYRKALAAMKNRDEKDIKCLLYYIRHKKIIDISDEACVRIDKNTLDKLSRVSVVSDFESEQSV